MIDPPPTPDDEGPEEESEGRLGPTSYVVVVGWALAGLVLGWGLRILTGAAPVVSWGQPAALWLVAVVIATTAWQTHRAVQVRRERLEPHRAVNRLVLARAGAYVGALVAGAYAGFALSWVGDPAELASQRIVRSLVGVAAALVIVIGSFLLERACRVRRPPRR